MRTKTLLTAVAALAAGISISQAQPVYSANVVGYANVATPGNGATYYMMAVPFVIGVSNGANEVFQLDTQPHNIPDGSEILTWDTVNQVYNLSFYDSTTAPNSWWDSPNENFNVPTPDLPVGQGFFFLPSANVTNTLSGVVACNVGTNITMSLAGNGATYFLLGGLIPYSGAITNGNSTGGGLNFGNLPDGSEVLTFDSVNQVYDLSFYDSTTAPNSWWDSPNENFNVPVPTVGIGQGFFVLPSASVTITNGL